MGPTFRESALQRNSPTFTQPHASARAESVARPQNVLGAEPRRNVSYFTQLAESAMGPNAAQQQPPLPELYAPGAIVDTTA